MGSWTHRIEEHCGGAFAVWATAVDAEGLESEASAPLSYAVKTQTPCDPEDEHIDGGSG